MPKHESSSSSRRRESRRGQADRSRSRSPGPPADRPTLTDADYYARNAEFRKWLLKKKDIYFDELGSKEARRYFKTFVEKWNEGRLSSKYYAGIRPTDLNHRTKTRHQWGFAKNMNDQEKELIRDTVTEGTAAQRAPPTTTASRGAPQGPQRNPHPSVDRRPYGAAALDNHERRLQSEEAREAERDRLKRARRDHRQTHESVLEELVPKPTGRDALLAKRRQASAYHREEPDLDPVLPDAELLGGDPADRSLTRLTAQQQRKERIRQERQEERQTGIRGKVAEHQSKEQATIAMLRQMAEQSRNMGRGLFEKK
ncbi:hypothetical protein IWQ60_012078 [Tieghemiomyces parasiticus]|uniref:Uncharacterized protein n=1 Tax=Tieghemiomyces parasiticus TaxID=78921 RepID=A0A9W7ZMV1_9FUNG|nr:hypothetical protein IWQ60_012078 [Tieghemiomyces parasiticus]